MNFIKDNNPPATEERIAKFEGRLGRMLPEDYRAFLLEHNGGVPEWQDFFISDCNATVIVSRLFGLDRPSSDIEKWTEELKHSLSEELIVIGFDPGGNRLLLDLSDSTVWYWDSARHFPCSSDEENTYEVASSFTDFINQLAPDKSEGG